MKLKTHTPSQTQSEKTLTVTKCYVRTFQVIYGFFQFSHRPLCKLSTGLSLMDDLE